MTAIATTPTQASGAPTDEQADRRRRSERYLDELFGPGAGARHTAFIDRLEHPSLRETLHGYHQLEADTQHLSVAENYLLGMVVLCAQRSYAPAAMFAKTLLHLGAPPAKLLEAIARLAMWVGGIAAAEAAAHIQKAIGEYQRLGLASLDAWFPATASAPR
jgi:alkylhydroperoxidase/carboxymuconolactone decarboxylase family protein YurZ